MMSHEGLLSIALGAATAGMALLALSISSHWRQIFGKRARGLLSLVVLRGGGALLLVASFAICVRADPILMATLVWPMLLMTGAGLVSACLALQAALARATPRS